MSDILAHSVPEAAKIIGLGRSSVYEEIRAGRLVARKARGRTIILHPDLVNYLSRLPTLKGSAVETKVEVAAPNPNKESAPARGKSKPAAP